MTKVSVIILPFRKPQIIKQVFGAVFAQTHKDLEIIAVINDPNDGSKEEIAKHFPKVKLLEPGENLWFAKGNNLGIKNSIGEFIQLVNDDLILQPNYIEEILKAFEDPRPSSMGEARPNEIGAAKVAAATGKILRYDFVNNRKTNIIDSTGIVMSVSGRARDRGQLEEDKGQYDSKYQIPHTKYQTVFGISGAGPMYRRSALEKVKYCFRSNSPRLPLKLRGGDIAQQKAGELRCEYFDEDFVAYWEDVDLSWRLNNAGFKNVYVPGAVAYHGRTAGQAKGGYLHLWHFIKHHSQLSTQIRQLNYKNHILMFIKNAPVWWFPAFLLRELAMLGYILVFETSTLKIVPKLLKQIPRTLRKRSASRLIRTN